jgi:hypothetical protein
MYRLAPMEPAPTPSLGEHRAAFARGRFLAMPLAGTLAWAAIGLGSSFLSETGKVWLVYLATGSIFYLGVLISKFTGEDLLGKHKPKNPFDNLFMASVISAWLVFAIAIPFGQADHTSIPLTVGILAGLMWLPFSWIIQHWIGYFHGIARTVLLLVAWYLFPEQRFTVLPAIIVAIYAVTIVVLMQRERAMRLQAVNA